MKITLKPVLFCSTLLETLMKFNEIIFVSKTDTLLKRRIELSEIARQLL